MDSFRNNGYYKFSKEDLYVEHDTVFAALIDPSLDPIEQAELLEKLKQRKENQTITVVIKQRPVRDSSHLKKYYIGNVTVFPDLPAIEDTLPYHNDTTEINRIQFISRTNKFKLSFLANNIYLHPGGLYKQQNYYRTSNRLNQFPAWEYHNIEFERSLMNDSLLDVTLRMYPAKKQKLSVSLEASYNTNSGLINNRKLICHESDSGPAEPECIPAVHFNQHEFIGRYRTGRPLYHTNRAVHFISYHCYPRDNTYRSLS